MSSTNRHKIAVAGGIKDTHVKAATSKALALEPGYFADEGVANALELMRSAKLRAMPGDQSLMAFDSAASQ